MSETASISSSIAGRYAQALFELAQSEGRVDALARDVQTLQSALADSSELRAMISSPIYTRDEQQGAVRGLAGPMGLDEFTASTLSLMASKRRLFALPHVLSALSAMIADFRGEMTVDVASAVPLTNEQSNTLSEMLNQRFGKQIHLNTTVDESLIGGLIVKAGSKMIDTSVRAKLANLQNAMKEVG